jgi:GNAT superfamily N-acetyltransferase
MPSRNDARAQARPDSNGPLSDSTTIRALARADLQATAALFTTILDSEFPFWPAEARAHHRASWSAEALRERLDASAGVSLIAVEAGGQPVALLFGSAPEGGVATVIWLLVAAAGRRRGLGRRLLAEARARYLALGCHKLKLTAPSEQARAYYQALGFRLEGHHPRHWWRIDFWSLGLELRDEPPGVRAQRRP